MNLSHFLLWAVNPQCGNAYWENALSLYITQLAGKETIFNNYQN